MNRWIRWVVRLYAAHSLYPDLQTREPLENVVDAMRDDITIRRDEAGQPELLFRYRNSTTAEHAVAELGMLLGAPAVQPVSLRNPRPVWFPVGCGLLGGILLGVLWPRFMPGISRSR